MAYIVYLAALSDTIILVVEKTNTNLVLIVIDRSIMNRRSIPTNGSPLIGMELNNGHRNLKQNETQRSHAESTHKGVN